MVSTTSASVEAQDLRSMEQTVSEAVEALIDRVLTETYIQSCAEDRTRAVQQVEEMVKREQERDHMEPVEEMFADMIAEAPSSFEIWNKEFHVQLAEAGSVQAWAQHALMVKRAVERVIGDIEHYGQACLSASGESDDTPELPLHLKVQAIGRHVVTLFHRIHDLEVTNHNLQEQQLSMKRELDHRALKPNCGSFHDLSSENQSELTQRHWYAYPGQGKRVFDVGFSLTPEEAKKQRAQKKRNSFLENERLQSKADKSIMCIEDITPDADTESNDRCLKNSSQAQEVGLHSDGNKDPLVELLEVQGKYEECKRERSTLETSLCLREAFGPCEQERPTQAEQMSWNPFDDDSSNVEMPSQLVDDPSPDPLHDPTTGTPIFFEDGSMVLILNRSSHSPHATHCAPDGMFHYSELGPCESTQAPLSFYRRLM